MFCDFCRDFGKEVQEEHTEYKNLKELFFNELLSQFSIGDNYGEIVYPGKFSDYSVNQLENIFIRDHLVFEKEKIGEGAYKYIFDIRKSILKDSSIAYHVMSQKIKEQFVILNVLNALSKDVNTILERRLTISCFSCAIEFLEKEGFEVERFHHEEQEGINFSIINKED